MSNEAPANGADPSQVTCQNDVKKAGFEKGPMSPLDWFILGVRLFGVWLMIRGIEDLVTYLGIKWEFAHSRSEDPAAKWFFYGFFDLMISAYLLLGAKHFATLCYRRDVNTQSGFGAETQNGQDNSSATPT